MCVKLCEPVPNNVSSKTKEYVSMQSKYDLQQNINNIIVKISMHFEIVLKHFVNSNFGRCII